MFLLALLLALDLVVAGVNLFDLLLLLFCQLGDALVQLLCRAVQQLLVAHHIARCLNCLLRVGAVPVLDPVFGEYQMLLSGLRGCLGRRA